MAMYSTVEKVMGTCDNTTDTVNRDQKLIMPQASYQDSYIDSSLYQ